MKKSEPDESGKRRQLLLRENEISDKGRWLRALLQVYEERMGNSLKRLVSELPLTDIALMPSMQPSQLNQLSANTSPSSSSQALAVAEASRPCREFKEHLRQDRGKVGRPRSNAYEPTVLTNWMSPLLWMTIERVALHFKPEMSPADIVRELKKLNSAQFSRLAPQTLGRWIDRTGEAPRWSDKTIARVQDGNRPGGTTTRVGVLVCTMTPLSSQLHANRDLHSGRISRSHPTFS